MTRAELREWCDANGHSWPPVEAWLTSLTTRYKSVSVDEGCAYIMRVLQEPSMVVRPEEPAEPFDMDKAQELLTEAGYE